MKKFLFLLIPVLGMMGCSQSKPLSKEEAWKSFCTSITGAAYNVMTDRQQNIAKDAALEHAKKIPEPEAQKYLIELINEAYKVPIYQQLAQQQQAMEDFSKGRVEQCIKEGPRS